MTKTANSLAGYIALLRQLALLCKVGSAIAAAIARLTKTRKYLQCYFFVDCRYQLVYCR